LKGKRERRGKPSYVGQTFHLHRHGRGKKKGKKEKSNLNSTAQKREKKERILPSPHFFLMVRGEERKEKREASRFPCPLEKKEGKREGGNLFIPSSALLLTLNAPSGVGGKDGRNITILPGEKRGEGQKAIVSSSPPIN